MWKAISINHAKVCIAIDNLGLLSKYRGYVRVVECSQGPRGSLQGTTNCVLEYQWEQGEQRASSNRDCSPEQIELESVQ